LKPHPADAITMMRLERIAELVDAVLITGTEEPDVPVEVEHCYIADLMSDVLAFCPPDALLITGLTNTQVVRTADVADIKAVVFVQSKKPDHETVALARKKQLPLLATSLPGFEVCARLHKAGLGMAGG